MSDLTRLTGSQEVQIVDPSLGNVAQVTGQGALRVDASFNTLSMTGSVTQSGAWNTNLDRYGTADTFNGVGQSAVYGNINSGSAITVVVTGTWVGTLAFSVSNDGTNFVAASAFNGTSTVSSTTGNGMFVIAGGGFKSFKIAVTAWTSGIATCVTNFSNGTNGVVLTTPIPSGTNSIGTVQPGNTQNTTAWLTTDQYYKPASSAVTATAATASAVTLTIPAVASQFHYIALIEIVKYATAFITGTATPVVVTTTNLPGSLAYTFDTAQAGGTALKYVYSPAVPLRSSVVNTATTIVCPATTSVIWRVNVMYYAAA